MKTKIAVAFIFFSLTISIFSQDNKETNTEVLLGEWKLDMSPQTKDDNNFALMRITSVEDNKMEGIFYREGVQLKNGQINTQRGIIYAALTSGDNSGDYNTSFYYDNGKLYGTTHAVDRDFLSVWIADKVQ
ncbi:hypothetical protein [Maribacter aestuarii]|uniref:hypothetical protein n=1 Tax=Maribacter aestuarii TaxID=1130723 RepID=UPI00248C3131|nr:hypothetical protein [Maribacter aestuarii]